MALRPQSGQADEAAINRQAADWVARRDRGLTSAEQDAYLQWLREDPRKKELVARHERMLRGILQLSDGKPQDLRDSDLELLASRRRRRWISPSLGLAVAAAIAIAFLVGRARWVQARAPVSGSSRSEKAADPYLRVNESQVLADGSVVELREGSSIAVNYTPAERRVRLIAGEAIFTVAKNPHRPFTVETSGVGVVAVGTVFDVRQVGPHVDVLVTEGKVRIQKSVPEANSGGGETPRWPMVSAGQRATMTDLETAAPKAQLATLDAVQIGDALAWRAPRLQFAETPLADALAEFNHYSSRRITLGDRDLASVPIGGSFRSDNVDGFVRSLHSILGLRVEEGRAGEIVLRRGH